MTPFLVPVLLTLLLLGDSYNSRTAREEDFLGTRVDVTERRESYVDADTVKSGQTFITNLPDSVAGQPVLRYRGIALPARSWLMRQSFFWKTSDQDRGAHTIWFRAFLKDESVDSLSVQVIVK